MIGVTLLENPRMVRILCALYPIRKPVSGISALWVGLRHPKFAWIYFSGISMAMPFSSFFRRLFWTYASLRNSVESIFDYSWILSGSVATLSQRGGNTRLEGLSHLTAAVSTGAPLVVYTCHTGPFFNSLFHPDIKAAIRGRRVLLLAPTGGQKRKKMLEEKIQSHLGKEFEIAGIDQENVGLKVLKTLKRNGIVICTLDLSFPQTKNRWITLLKRPVELPIGIIEVGLKLEAIFVASIPTLHGGGIRVRFEKPVRFRRSDMAPQDCLSVLLETVEKTILEKPSRYTMWPWFHNYQRHIHSVQRKHIFNPPEKAAGQLSRKD